MKDEKGVFSRASRTEEIEKYGNRFSAKRVKLSYPVILVFEKWMKDTYPTVLPKSRIGQAIEYAFTLLPRLSRYVNDGRISIDNNPVERAIRPLVLEKKPALLRQ